MISVHAAQRAQHGLYTGGPGFSTSIPGYNLGSTIGQERINQVEVHRKQVDEVFTSLESTGELDQSDPGPYIKTELFPHQRKALTFLLQREQDSTALKRGKKYAERALRKKQRNVEKLRGKSDTKPGPTKTEGDGEEGVGKDKANSEGGDQTDGEAGGSNAPITVDNSAEGSPIPEETKKVENARTLWEPIKDEKGKIRRYKNRVTGAELKVKKGDKPPDTKGAILADDVSSSHPGNLCSHADLVDGSRENPIDRLTHCSHSALGEEVAEIRISTGCRRDRKQTRTRPLYHQN